jgi:hypothetical protein
MPTQVTQDERVRSCLREFLQSTGRTGEFADSTYLTRDLGLKSDEGVDFVLDLCDEFKREFPGDFNPFVHPSGRRGLRVVEMISAVLSHLPA